MKPVGRVVLQSAILVIASAALGLLCNWLRPAGLPLVATEPYPIFTRCPEMTKEATGVDPADLGEASGLVILDARPRKDFEQQPIPGSRSVPYDPLFTIDEALLEELKKLPAGRILVVGDQVIDSGRLLAAELAAAGIPGVRYLRGGFSAWVEAGRDVRTGEAQ